MSDLKEDIESIIERLAIGSDITDMPGSNIYHRKVEIALPTHVMAERILTLVESALMSEDVLSAMRFEATVGGSVTREGAFGVHVDHKRLMTAALEAAGIVDGDGYE